MTPPPPPRPTPAEPLASWPERTPFGATWRGGAVLAFALAGIAFSSWTGSKLMRYDDRLGAGPAIVVSMAALVLVMQWLRARNGYVVFTMAGSLLGAVGGSPLLQGGYLSAHRPYLSHSPWATAWASTAAVGTAIALVAIISGTVSGYRNPRPVPSQDPDRKAPDSQRT